MLNKSVVSLYCMLSSIGNPVGIVSTNEQSEVWTQAYLLQIPLQGLKNRGQVQDNKATDCY